MLKRQFRGKIIEDIYTLRTLHNYEGKRARKGKLLDLSGKDFHLTLPRPTEH